MLPRRCHRPSTPAMFALLLPLLFAMGCDSGVIGPGSSSPCADPESLIVTPSSLFLKGKGATVTADARPQDAGGADASCAAVWTSLNPAVATVSADGVVTAERDGQAVIEATAGDRVAYALATVSVGAVAVEEWAARTQPTGADLNAVWGTSTSNVFAVGDGGTTVHFDGDSWRLMESGTSADLLDVWGWSGDKVWAVGRAGTILRSDGSGWTPVESGTTADLSAVWGPSPHDVYAVGDGILHYDGTGWRTVVATGHFTDIWGADSGEMMVTEVVFESWEDPFYRHAAVHRFDGAELQPMAIRFPPDPDGHEMESGLLALHGTSAEHVVAVGYGYPVWGGHRYPYMIEYDGTDWSLVESGDSLEVLNGVWLATAETGYAVGKILRPRTSGSQILAASGSVWDRVRVRLHVGLRGVWGTGSDVFAVGEEGAILRNEGSGWRVVHAPLPPVQAVWGAVDDTVVAVGVGAVLHYDGMNWAGDVDRFRHGIRVDSLTGVWGTATSHMVAVGANGGVFGFDGSRWKGHGYLMDAALLGVWGSAPDNIVVVGEGGAIYHSRPSGWERVQSGTTATLRGVWGFGHDRMIAVGDGGTLLSYDGARWASEASGTGADLTSVWGSDPDSLYVVGGGGTILRGTESGWLTMETPTTARLEAVWGTSADNVYAVGRAGVLLHYDGQAWRTLSSGTTVDLHGLWGSIDGWWAVSPTTPGTLLRGGGE